ncbi:MAG TPA: hybrid sensor histidine kinase/response regulator, partial [Cyanobacteria bacterium UBA8156]|nr:hybrid sensor histidine kinase/response regulator [Cyanobacteria bacterium UBA8156]
LGYPVWDSVASGEEALAMLATGQPDLALCDIQLAGALDGIALSEILHDQFGIPVVFLTAHGDVLTLERAKRVRPFGYIVKPFQEKDLHVAIEMALTRHAAEQGLRDIAAKDRELREIKARFLGTAVHDIRNPLSSIALAADMLHNSLGGKTTERQERNFRRIQNGIEAIRTLLDEVLDLNRLESEQLAFTPVPLDVVRWCESLIEEIQESAGDRYQLRLQCPASLSALELDEVLIQRILSNLLSNAVKYSPTGGAIELELTWAQGWVTFRVRDWGMGIAPEAQEKIFQAFQRGPNVGDIPGTGLGLTIVKMCVDVCQGNLSLESSPGEGTEITVRLPAPLAVRRESRSCA